MVDPGSQSCRPASRRATRIAYLVAGSISLGLGSLGVLIPVLPTTPFVILAAFCFARGSVRAHCWLLENRVFGPLLRDYLAGRGVSRRVKAGALVFLWAVLGVSIGLFVPMLWARVLLGVIGVAVTIHIVMIKSRKGEGRSQRMPES